MTTILSTDGAVKEELGMKAIDFEVKGNVVRIFLGQDDLDRWWGDDWDDAPYEHNAGMVYDEYVAGHIDVAFPFDAIVLEPCDGEINSPWSKQDMQEGRVPMLAVLASPPADRWRYEDSFSALMGHLDLGVWLCIMGQSIGKDFEAFLPSGAQVLEHVVTG